jgi:phospholipase C
MSRRSLLNSPPREWRLTSILMLLGSGLCLPYTALAGNENDPPTKTPIKHVVVIFQENRSFDQYLPPIPSPQICQARPRFMQSKARRGSTGYSLPGC